MYVHPGWFDNSCIGFGCATLEGESIMTISRLSIVPIILLIGLISIATLAPVTSAFQTTPAATGAATAMATGAATAMATAAATAMAPAPGTPAQAPAAPATVLQITQNSALGGSIVTDSQQRTLYIFTNDTNGVSNCTGNCATLWPPFTGTSMSPSAPSSQMTPSASGTSTTGGAMMTPGASSTSTAGGAMMTPGASGTTTAGSSMMTIDSSKVTTVQRSDGTTQIAYNGHPLYYYSGDAAPGDTKGQGLNGSWFVISPDGTPMQSGGSSAPAGSTPSTSPTP